MGPPSANEEGYILGSLSGAPGGRHPSAGCSKASAQVGDPGLQGDADPEGRRFEGVGAEPALRSAGTSPGGSALCSDPGRAHLPPHLTPPARGHGHVVPSSTCSVTPSPGPQAEDRGATGLRTWVGQTRVADTVVPETPEVPTVFLPVWERAGSRVLCGGVRGACAVLRIRHQPSRPWLVLTPPCMGPGGHFTSCGTPGA